MADHRLGFESFEEEPSPTTLDVEGELPDWLTGTLLRNGPGLFDVGGEAVTHWFDGLALLRRFRFDDGIEYSSRFLRSEAYLAAARGELAFREFGTNPSRSLLDRVREITGETMTDNASVTVRHRDGEFRAVTETSRELAFDPEELTTLGERRDAIDATGTLAHDHYDPLQEERVGLGIDFGSRSGYLVYRDPDDGPTEEIARIGADEPAYMHSFALTDHYVVLTEHPFTVPPTRLLGDRPFIENFRWYPERETRFLVVDRRTGETVAAPSVPPFFTFHHVDAYERASQLVLDLVAFEDHSFVESLALANLRSRSPAIPGGELRRYRIDLDAETASDETLFSGPIEFPTIHYAEANTHPYRYCYGVGKEPGSFNDRLHKVDVEHATTETWDEEGLHPGEALFVPDPGGEEEDDGVLLSVALDVEEERSCVLVLDAAGFEEVARAYLPDALPFDFHGAFYPDGERPIPSMS
ncbi:carotenoid oxygenase family protein [Halalkalicoccus ordinarius]|uniref:carotenoid oxygenase family protein n=1 Tax=Halalkalicoccus ordinarius TaxID=3116651 RepID=UPI00300EE8A1